MQNAMNVSNNPESPDEQHQLAREEALFLYSNALYRKDFDSAALILQQAEVDPALEQMILDLSPYLEMEYLDVVGGSAGSLATSRGDEDSSSDGITEYGDADRDLGEDPSDTVDQLVESGRRTLNEAERWECEWQDFLAGTTDISADLSTRYLLAMDHLDRAEYQLAEESADAAVQMALQLNDLEATAECLCLYGIIESAQRRYREAGTLFRIGLLILDQADRDGVHPSNDLRLELEDAVTRLTRDHFERGE